MKKLLFIDDKVLHFDQTAGARTSYMYLKLLIELDFSITFIASDFNRTEPYASHLESLGVRVLTGKLFRYLWKLWFFLFAHKFDYVFCNRPRPTKLFLDFIEKRSKAKLLYQCHDLHYLRLNRQFEIDGDQTTREVARKIEKMEDEIILKSDVFLTFSQYEKLIIEKKLPGNRTEVVPLYFYEKTNPPITDFADRTGILHVGGFAHQPNLDAVQWFVDDILPTVLNVCPDIVIYFAGSNPPSEIKALENKNLKILGFVSDEELNSLYRSVKLAIIPLRYGAGVKGKTMEAVHHSLPFVSTAVGLEGIGLEGIVPPTDSPEDFGARIISLYQDNSNLIESSIKLHEYAEQNLSIAEARTKMKSILDSLT